MSRRERFLTLGEAGRVLGAGRETVSYYRRRGDIKVAAEATFGPHRTMVLFNPKDVEALARTIDARRAQRAAAKAARAKSKGEVARSLTREGN